jgi:hypothetical protein
LCTGEEGVKFDVMNSQTYAGYVVHVGSLPSGSIKVLVARMRIIVVSAVKRSL